MCLTHIGESALKADALSSLDPHFYSQLQLNFFVNKNFFSFLPPFSQPTPNNTDASVIEEHILDTNAEKQLS